MSEKTITDFATDKAQTPKRKNKLGRKLLIVVSSVLIGSMLWEYAIGAPRQACACAPDEDYFAHFTDEQALAIIQARFEEAGLNFTNDVPIYTVERYGGRRWGRDVGIDLFDEERNVAITFINLNANTISSVNSGGGSQHWLTTQITQEFSEDFEEIHFGVFYNPSVWRPWDMQRRWFSSQSHTDLEIERLTEQLENQIQEFIEQLRRDGLID